MTQSATVSGNSVSHFPERVTVSGNSVWKRRSGELNGHCVHKQVSVHFIQSQRLVVSTEATGKSFESQLGVRSTFVSHRIEYWPW
jgi:hypothetical protein